LWGKPWYITSGLARLNLRVALIEWPGEDQRWLERERTISAVRVHLPDRGSIRLGGAR
jgi:hypothetical protein